MTTNSELQTRRAAAIPRGIASMTGVFADRAENAEIWDVDGRRFVDFAGGIAVLNTGHRHPKVMAAVAEQEKRFTHTAFQVMAYDSYIALAERLNALVPIPDAKTLFMNSGAEAVENAVKIARAYTGRSAVIAFNGAFHGRSLLTMGLTGKILPYKAKFGPFPGDIYHAPFPIEHHGISEEQSLSALAWLFKTNVEASRVAAIIIEPVQGEGGFYVAPQTFMKALREICDQHGILLICDEVQTGFARTGKLFAMEHYGIEPDMMTLAKSLAGGFPLSAISSDLGRAGSRRPRQHLRRQPPGLRRRPRGHRCHRGGGAVRAQPGPGRADQGPHHPVEEPQRHASHRRRAGPRGHGRLRAGGRSGRQRTGPRYDRRPDQEGRGERPGAAVLRRVRQHGSDSRTAYGVRRDRRRRARHHRALDDRSCRRELR